MSAPPKPSQWTYLTNHTHVLVCLVKHGDMKMREIAQLVGITERAVQRIILELEAGGAVVRERHGRSNRYQVNLDVPLRHNLEGEHTLGELLSMINQL